MFIIAKKLHGNVIKFNWALVTKDYNVYTFY